MRRQSSLWRLALASAGLMVLVATAFAQDDGFCDLSEVRACVRMRGDTQLLPATTASTKRLPILFVHGYNTDSDQDTDFNYRKNWQDELRPSFKQAVGLNAWADIEDYYIRFQNQGHSISEDATDISDAIDLILHRHDPTNYAYPYVSGQTTDQKVVVIAYSKGTISTRLYLKSLRETVPGMPAPRLGFNPVSEFIAISPPNHGISLSFGSTCAAQQLMNGRDVACIPFMDSVFTDPQPCDPLLEGGPNFISDLNFSQALNASEEAPGSRPDTLPSRAPTSPTDGTLYVAIYADRNRDLVGGEDRLSGQVNCDGDRRRAKNLSPNAVNIEVAGISNNSASTDLGRQLAVHGNTPHTAEVICQALYTAAHHRSPEGITCTLDGTLPVIPRAAVVLTLDFSGSMRLPSCQGCQTSRADILKDAVELFGQLWLASGEPNDRLGAVYFQTNVTKFPNNDVGLVSLGVGGNDVIDNLDLQTPANSTAMGGGLQQAINTLRNARARRPISRIILFTDGIQNVNPMVQRRIDQLVIDDEPGRTNSNVSETNPPTVLDSSLGIAVDTLGIGDSANFVTLLNDIAINTGGSTQITSQPEDEMRRMFIEALVNTLRGMSPQLVDYRHGTIGQSGSTEVFPIESGVRKVILKVSWKRGKSMSFSVSRNGADVTSLGRIIQGEFYKIFVIDLPLRGSIHSRGNWQLHIKGAAATGYEAAAMVEGGLIDYDGLFNIKRPKVGDVVELVVRLSSGRRVIAGNPRVTVKLVSPKVAVERIIATQQLKEVPVLEPGMTLVERRLLGVMLDPKLRIALKPKLTTISLKPNDKGEFRTRIRARVPGVYTAIVTIKGNDEKLGRFSRTQTVTTVVRLK